MLRVVSALFWIVSLSVLSGCAENENTTEDTTSLDASVVPEDLQTEPCPTVRFRFSAEGSEEMEIYPDDRLTVVDADSLSGVRLSFDVERFPWLDALPTLIKPTKEDFEFLTGFPHNGGILLRFEGSPPLPLPDPLESLTDVSIMILDLDTSPPARIPYESRLAIDGQGIFVDPLVTLTPGHRYAVLMTKTLWGDEVCVEDNLSFQALLDGEFQPLSGDERFANGLHEALDASAVSRSELFGGTVFTTHMDHLLLKDVSRDIRARNYTWDALVECETAEGFRVCNAAFKAWDFRDPFMIRTNESNGRWMLKVRIFLPEEGSSPVPVLIYGHGLNSDRFEADRLAAEFCEEGFGVVAVDAMMHGDHPTRVEGSSLTALDFLGVNIPQGRVDGTVLHGNFTQTVMDRLQLLQLLRRSPDFDGDGIDDFDPMRIGYFGVSLGGMLGSIFLANAESIPAAVLSIAGGRLIQFLSDIPQIEPFRPALNNLAGGELKAERILLFAQTLVDSADPATFAPFVLRNRWNAGSLPPHLLMPVANQDSTVPPSTAHALARALGLPHVGPVFTKVFGLENQEVPIANNTPYNVTAGYFQFDRITNESGDDVNAAEHEDLPPSPEALLQTKHFLNGWKIGEIPEIIDPYEILGTEPL